MGGSPRRREAGGYLVSDIEPPRGHRYHQLRVASDLIKTHQVDGRLVDVGAGSGWLCRGWTSGPAVGVDRYRSEEWERGLWIVGDTARLPVRGSSASTCTAIAALGAFPPDRLPAVLEEIHRVLHIDGVFVALFSQRSTIYDALGPHRLLSRYRWSSFDGESVSEMLVNAGFSVDLLERRGTLTTLVAEWLHLLTTPLARWTPGRRLHDRLGELDGRGFRAPRPRGRYVYVVAHRQ